MRNGKWFKTADVMPLANMKQGAEVWIERFVNEDYDTRHKCIDPWRARLAFRINQDEDKVIGREIHISDARQYFTSLIDEELHPVAWRNAFVLAFNTGGNWIS